MKRYLRKIVSVVFLCLAAFLHVNASDKASSGIEQATGYPTVGMGVLGLVATVAAVKNSCAKTEQQLIKENQALRDQNTALGIALAVCEQGDDHHQLRRERDQLKQAVDSLEQQNRILAEFCPLLQEAARQEFPGKDDPDIVKAWGCD